MMRSPGAWMTFLLLSAPAAAAPETLVEQDRRLLEMISIQSTIESCNTTSEFRRKHMATYVDWRMSNDDLFSRLERSEPHQRLLAQAREKRRAQMRAAGEGEKFSTYCDQEFMPAMRTKIR